MKKTLHIIPNISWEEPVENWVNRQTDKEEHEILSYPVRADLHYIPESFSIPELMRTALSWEKVRTAPPVHELYQKLRAFADILLKKNEYDKVIVWHAEDVESRMLLCLVMNDIEHNLFEMDITPSDKRHIWEAETDDYKEDIEVPLFCVGHLDSKDSSISGLKPQRVTESLRKEYRTIWMNWAGEDLQDCPIIINQFGRFVHVHRPYLYSDILSTLSKTESLTASDVFFRLREKHPQVVGDFIYESLHKMAAEGFIKCTKKVKGNRLQNEFIKYKYDVEGDWNGCKGWPRDFVYQFIPYCGKKIKMSEDDIKAEFIRDHKDCEDMWGQGHLTREERRKRRSDWEERMVVKWAAAFNENWGWYHLMSVMKVKMEMMAEYMRHWTPVADGAFYADQIERAISLMEIIIDWGGNSRYEHSEDENDYLDAKHFSPYVNMRNRKRFPGPDNYDDHRFWCEAQRVRFHKAWNILWDLLRDNMLTWED